MISEEIVANLIVNGGQWEAGFAKASASMNSFEQRAKRTGKSMQSAGKSMTMGMTVPIVALGGLAVKSAMDFETAMTGVEKVLNDVDAGNIDQLSDSVQDLAVEFGQSSTEIAKTMEIAGQLGINGAKNLTGFTKTMVMLGKTTDLTSEQAATGIAKLGNAFGVKTKNMGEHAGDVGDAIVALGNNFGATEPEILAMTNRMAGGAKTAGVSMEASLGLAAALTEVGINAEAGGTAMSKTMSEMNSAVIGGGKELQTYAKVSGQTAEEFKKSWETDAGGAIIEFAAGLKEAGKSGADVDKILASLGITSIRQKEAIKKLGANYERAGEAAKMAAQQFGEGGAASDEWATRSGDLAVQFGQFQEELRRVGVTVGESLMPAMRAALDAAGPLISGIQSLATGFTKLPGPVQTGVIGFLAFAAAAGPVTYLGGKVVAAVGAISGAFKALAASSVVSSLRGASVAQTALITSSARAQGAAIAQSAAYQTLAGTGTAAAAANTRLAATNTAVATTSRAAGAGMATAGAGATTAATGATGLSAAFSAIAGPVAAAGAVLHGFAFGLERLSFGAPVTDLKTLENQLDATLSSGTVQLGSFGDGLEAMGNEVENQGPLVGQWLSAFNPIGKSMPEWTSGITGFVGATTRASDEISGMDAMLSQLVTSGNAEKAAQGYELMALKSDGTRVSAEKMREVFPQYNAAIASTGAEADSTTSSLTAMDTAMNQTNFLGKAQAGMQFRDSLSSIKTTLDQGNGSWTTARSMIMSAAQAQASYRNQAVQAAGDNQAAVDKANTAYGQQAVKLGALVPKAQQSGSAFKALARSAGLSTGQLQSAVNAMKSGGKDAGQALAQALGQSTGKVKNSAKKLANAAKPTGSDGTKQKWAKKGKEPGDGFQQGAKQSQSKIKSAGKSVMKAAESSVKSGGKNLQNAGKSAGKGGGEGLAQALKSATGKVKSAAKSLVDAAKSALDSAKGSLQSAGQSAGQAAGQGMVAGLNSQRGAVMATASSIASAAAASIRSALKVSSPSKVTTKIGKQIVQGLIAGLGKEKKKLKKRARQDIADTVTREFRDGFSKLKQKAQTWVSYIDGIRDAVKSRGSLTGFDVGSAQTTHAGLGAAAAEDAALAKKAANDHWAASMAVIAAQDQIAAAEKSGNHYQVAAAIDAVAEAQARAATTATEHASAQEKAAQSSQALAASSTPTAKSVLDDMEARVKEAEGFAKAITDLRARGLNEQSVQDLIEKGAAEGGKTANLLLSQGGVNRANQLQSRLGSAANTVGDVGGVSKYGHTRAQAQGIVDTQINVTKGAVVLNWGNASVTKADKVEMERIADKAFTKAMKQLQREAEQKRKARK